VVIRPSATLPAQLVQFELVATGASSSATSPLQIAVGAAPSGSLAPTAAPAPPAALSPPPPDPQWVDISATTVISAATPAATQTSGTTTSSAPGPAVQPGEGPPPVTYSAIAQSMCWPVINGTPSPCPLPPGTTGIITWTAIPVSFIYDSDPLPLCTASVTALNPVAGCQISWGTYGDHQLQVSFTSTAAPAVQGQLTGGSTLLVHFPAPLDLAINQTFNSYGNDTEPDCFIASAADYLQIVTGTAPDPAAIQTEYLQLADLYNMHNGIAATALFSYWQKYGIGGYRLATATQISTADVPGYLVNTQRPLLTEVALPENWGGGPHAWVVAGTSPYGVMIVTWGQELNITWSQFYAWTWQVWAISLTAS